MNQLSEKIQSKQPARPTADKPARPTAGEKDTLFYVAELKSEECACGRRKKSGFSFCYKDYAQLPFEMKKALYRQIGNGYEEAYEEAYKWLFG